MEDQLDTNISHLGFWLEETWTVVEKVSEEEYQQEAVQLLIVAAAFLTLLQDFRDNLDEAAIDFCFCAILNIFSLIRLQSKLFRRGGFTKLNAVGKETTLELMIEIRQQGIIDFKEIIRKYGLSELY